MVVPGFLKNGRQLGISMDSLNVEDVLDIQFFLKSDIDPEELEYSL